MTSAGAVRALHLLALLLTLGGCARHLGVLQAGSSVAVLTPNVGSSMIYAARTDSSVVLIDLGWTGADGSIETALRRLGAAPEEVTDVFLTHSHRDHVFGWREVRHARFHLWAPEVPHFTGGVPHRDRPSRAAAAVFPHAYPAADSVRVLPFAGDTAFALGRDTLRAFTVPGHTAGSAAYLFRGVLFAGDALYYSYLSGFGLAAAVFTADAEENRRSVAALFERLRGRRVEWVCTAHGKCAEFEAIARKLRSRGDLPGPR